MFQSRIFPKSQLIVHLQLETFQIIRHTLLCFQENHTMYLIIQKFHHQEKFRWKFGHENFADMSAICMFMSYKTLYCSQFGLKPELELENNYTCPVMIPDSEGRMRINCSCLESRIGDFAESSKESGRFSNE